MRWPRRRAFCASITMVWTLAVGAQPMDEEEELALIYGDKSMISITTGAAQPLARAPAVATVITAQDIESIGATDLNEVLESVPGLHVSHSALGYAPIYTIRGIGTQYNPQVLVLTNGIPMTSVFAGDRGNVWGGLPVDNIARIEVIRGPGSALYGADAFSGVINIITKTAADTDGTQAGARIGSFQTHDAWMLHGGKWGAIDVAGYVRIARTNGAKETIVSDGQTQLDAGFHTHASLAPGTTNLGYDAIDASLDLAYKKWRFRAGLKRRNDVQSGPGVAQTLDPTGTNFGERLTGDLTYQDKEFTENWDVTLQASYYHLNEKSNLVLYPPGATFGNGVFVDGMIGNPYKWERHLRFTASAFYTGFESHRVRIGAGRENDDLYKVQESKNYRYDPVSLPGSGNVLTPTPLGSVVDVSGTGAFMTPHERTVNYIYVQDEWTFKRDWTLTGGVRRDQYSDFGGTTNPRLALVWDAAYNVTAKLLAGRAFRAPSFVELYNINNPVSLGNPDLKPETISTQEAAVSWQPTGAVQINANVFQYRMRDIIRYVAGANGLTAQNTGGQTGKGLELEASWDVSRRLRLSGNYAYQRSINDSTSTDAGDAPHHHLYLRADWRFGYDWMGNVQFNQIAGRDRAAGDSRPTVPNYHTVDLTLRNGKTGPGRWDFAFSVRNLFAATVFEPSPLAPLNIPGDFPMAGRSMYVQARYGL
jgi:outer membrane receptor for ferrienterochelin and colicins